MKKFLFIGLLLSFIFVIAAAIVAFPFRASTAMTQASIDRALLSPVAIVAQKVAQNTDSEMTPQQSLDANPSASESSGSQGNVSSQERTPANENADPTASQQNTETEASDRPVGGPYDVKAIEDAYRSLYGS